ncbi:pantoate--beta-alanine ligase [Parafrankia sp. FMc2]|uniref:pantoate--beta-alanine ligase n=1 Tax=Parafrankia sp. FMc2 TaxID=3233196 RepID=UPI0034D586AE
MIIYEAQTEVRERLEAERAAGRRGAMVGTSGGTHEGHLSLVHRAKQECDHVAVFWNSALKLEWAPGAVLSYTRDMERDAALFEAAGVDLFYVPLRHDLCRRLSATFIAMPGMVAHLDGMPEGANMELLVTMVLTLLNIAGPCTTYFGEKDWQQLVMFQRMAEDLRLPSRVLGCPMLREPDGVAFSSRNTKLSAEQRAAAPTLYRGLYAAAEAIKAGERDAKVVTDLVKDLLRPVSSPDYVVAVEADTLRPLDTLTGEVRLLASATTPLVDNIGVTVPA